MNDKEIDEALQEEMEREVAEIRFKEKFLSLISEYGKYDEFSNKNSFPQNLIEKHCIGKQRVKDAIHKSISKWDLKFSVTNSEIEEDLLKKLGLEE